MKKILLTTLAAAALLGSGAGQAMAAEGCEGVKLTLRNKSGDTIRIVRFEHYDAATDSWVAEDLGTKVVKPRARFSWEQPTVANLDTAKTRVIFNAKIGDDRWSDELTKELAEPKCRKTGKPFDYDQVIWGS
ncbi:MAG: hypothetical protein KC635_13320 [Myxococcales bacterium]|nr:hypothetical protein [Myxococcales bacterium]MCB9736673.1 hypothetical protein [Deltaproteobacteria bacterium]